MVLHELINRETPPWLHGEGLQWGEGLRVSSGQVRASRALSWGVPDPAHPSGNGSLPGTGRALPLSSHSQPWAFVLVPPEGFMESLFHPSKAPAGFVQLFDASTLEIPGVALLSQPIPVNLNTFPCCSGLQQGRHPCARAWAQFVILSEI